MARVQLTQPWRAVCTHAFARVARLCLCAAVGEKKEKGKGKEKGEKEKAGSKKKKKAASSGGSGSADPAVASLQAELERVQKEVAKKQKTLQKSNEAATAARDKMCLPHPPRGLGRCTQRRRGPQQGCFCAFRRRDWEKEKAALQQQIDRAAEGKVCGSAVRKERHCASDIRRWWGGDDGRLLNRRMRRSRMVVHPVTLIPSI